MSKSITGGSDALSVVLGWGVVIKYVLGLDIVFSH